MPENKSKFNTWSRLLHRRQVIRILEALQDFLVVLLCIGLLVEMGLLLSNVFFSLVRSLDEDHFKAITSDILLILILVELFRLLVVYLQEHQISVGVAVEISIVSVLREIIVHGLLDIKWEQTLGICAFLLVMGTLLWICTQTLECETPKNKRQHLLPPQQYSQRE
ncbi:MAG: hypothetical protein F6K10_19395 [Moorea sp. SIO2B7]|nr:hypothetical protein [Moorena sp. SIO2B7]